MIVSAVVCNEKCVCLEICTFSYAKESAQERGFALSMRCQS